MIFDELWKKVNKAQYELRKDKLDIKGYGVQIELSINSYRELLVEREYFAIKAEIDTSIEKVCRGNVFGVPFVLTQDTDRVLIAKEIQ